jgi:exodeoxyribonuclease VII large subunit
MPFPTEPQPRLDFERDVYTVSRLNSEVRAVLEGSFPLLWVEGEVSNLATPSSGHVYFSLKDAYAQVRCALFRGQRMRLRFGPENGMQVLLRARVSLYEGRGEFQLIVEHMEPAGEGALRQAFERLKQKLAAEGLFEPGRKRPLPAFARQIGVVTSPTGAALRDVLSVLRRRMPGLPVVLFPAAVQGAEAPGQLVRALELANARRECDVLLLVRGGGSLEDLMAFNDEAVARAVAASSIPVVCGVGHEIDYSIADFVADRRAPTPSAAAELVSPDRVELLQRLALLRRRLRLAQERLSRARSLWLEQLARRLALRHPASRLVQRQQRVDELELRLRTLLVSRLQQLDGRLSTLRARLRGQTPAHRLARHRLHLQGWQRRLQLGVGQVLDRLGDRLARAGGTLDAVSPLATLARGYAIVSRHPQGGVLRDASAVNAGQGVQARLARGRLLCRVERVLADE